MLAKAPFFNRIRMWRKFRGHAVYGANTAAVEGPGRGRGRGAALITPKTQGQLKKEAADLGTLLSLSFYFLIITLRLSLESLFLATHVSSSR